MKESFGFKVSGFELKATSFRPKLTAGAANPKL
jgi:hypothetical protein